MKDEQSSSREEAMKKAFLVGLAAGIGCGALALARAQQAASAQEASAAPAREISSLQLQQQIPVPNVMGRVDHMSADPKRRPLVVPALGNDPGEAVVTVA